MNNCRFLQCIIIVLCLFSSLSSQAFEGKVVSVSDGDTVSVMHDGIAEKVRLNGIDCPEIGQDFGKKAKQFASDMVFGEIVNVKEYGKDKYGRTIGDVFLQNGKSLNHELVKSGLAWWYKKYSNDKELEQLEQEARLAKRGLWTDSNHIAPWDWRHNPNASDKSTPIKLAINKSTSSEKQIDTVVYITRTGSKYHNAGCRYLKSSIKIKLSELYGYTPCSVCKPPISSNKKQVLSKQDDTYKESNSSEIKELNSVETAVVEDNGASSNAITGNPTGETTPRGYQIHTGPRGGRYHYSASGRKVYERRK